ncbi:MAG: PIG-L family deacetylase [Acidimicrobiales bacterium]|nr:PIG-L family deacetylase [Acidimicrobiales bacterium]MBO0887388.1 PIG-L family deacetylase [Acidimicrobiales bacterium]MBO0893031.1 PIG-L family deacetylase [Acidimicrobiales bacterium]
MGRKALHWPFRPIPAALAVVAHPDDESFGLGALLAGLVERGTTVSVLCFTHGEAGSRGKPGEDLASRRARELEAAAEQLGLSEVRLLDYRDGSLSSYPPARLEREIEDTLGFATTLVVFEPSGVTGHPDHRAVTAAAERVAVRWGLNLLEWGIGLEVVISLNREFHTAFNAFVPGPSCAVLEVDRSAQSDAIACHQSQLQNNLVLGRRLELQGERELVHWLPAVTSLRLSRRL